MLTDVRTRAALLTGNPLAAVPPIVVFTGAKQPNGGGEAEADAATLRSGHKKHGPKAAAKSKHDKPAKKKTAQAKS